MDFIKYAKKQAKYLLKLYKNGDNTARERIIVVLNNHENVTLQRVQHVIAVENGFLNWTTFIHSRKEA